MDFLSAIKALKRWRWTFLLVAAASFCIVAFAPQRGSQAMLQYVSEAKILLTPPSGNVNAYGNIKGAVGVDVSQSWFADPTVLKELLQSEELLTRVSEGSGSKQPWAAIKDMVEVEPLSQGSSGIKLFKLSVTASDPKESQKITRLINDEFANYVQELSAREFASTRKFVEELVVEAEQRRLGAEERLMAVREKYLGAPSDTEVTAKQGGIETQRMSVSQSIPALQAEVAALKSYLDGRATSPPWAVLEKTDTSLSALETQVADNEVKLDQVREIYTDENDKVISAKAKLERSKELYQKGLNDYVTSLYNSKSLELQQLSARERDLSAQLNTLLSSQMTPDDRRALQKLERELSIWEENHLSLLQQLYQARVVEQSSRRQGSVNILEQPRPGALVIDATASVATSRSKTMAMAVPFCLILGAAAALLRDYLSTSMKLRPRIEEALELPVIAVIPSTPSELTLDWERFKRPMSALPMFPGAAAKSDGKHAHANGKGNGNGRSFRDEAGKDRREMTLVDERDQANGDS